MVSTLAEDCTPNMRKRIGRRPEGMVKGRVAASGTAIDPD
jgi:hypothetical protein